MVEARGDVSVDELRAFVAERLADFKVPKDWELVDELPHLGLGHHDRSNDSPAE